MRHATTQFKLKPRQIRVTYYALRTLLTQRLSLDFCGTK